MDIISIINSRLGPMLGLLLGRTLSREQAYRMADWIAGLVVARSESRLVQGVRANQAVVRGLPYDSPLLNQAVRDVISNAARGYADWYRAVSGGPEVVNSSVTIDESLEQAVYQSIEDKRGVVIVGAHMSSFNILLLALGLRGYPIQALSYARVQGSYHVDNALRLKFGLNLTPISFQSLRQAVLRLRDGGLVMTAIDRPDVGGESLTFFGRQAKLPVGHARLALRTNSRILVGMVQAEGDGLYRAVCGSLIEPEDTGDQHQDVLRLAQRVLYLIEDYIRSRPGEWLIFLPIWPSVMTEHGEG